MINLLPESEKKLIAKEYKLRIIITILVLLILLIMVAIILLIPSYISISTKKHVGQDRIASRSTKETEEHKELVKEIQALKLSIGVLAPDAKAILPTDVLEALARNKSVDVTIGSLRYSVSEDLKFNVVITGNARTRQSLVTFTRGLEKESIVSKVDLPVSDLAKESDIKYSITIIGK